MRPALVLLLLVAASALSGCARPEREASTDPRPPASPTTPTGNFTAPPPSNARFQVSEINVTASNDGNRTTLYEDDDGATIRYTVSQPADASKETAFVTYLLNGRIVDVQQLTLEPGAEKVYARTLDELRTNRTFKIEVRAGSVVQRTESKVLEWPRAGEGTLRIGPISVRADYGLLAQDARALVNLSLAHDGPEQTFRDFRVKMLCLDEEDRVEDTPSVRLDTPSAGNTTSIDVSVEECDVTRYGLEFKASGANGAPLLGRLLLVPKGWTPSTAGDTQA